MVFPVLRIRIRDLGSGCFFDPWIRNRFLPDPGSKIPDPKPIFMRALLTTFWVKSSLILLKIGPNFFLQHFKKKIILNYVKFAATKKDLTTNFFSPLSFAAVFGSGIRDPGWVKIRIRDKHSRSATQGLSKYLSSVYRTIQQRVPTAAS